MSTIVDSTTGITFPDSSNQLAAPIGSHDFRLTLTSGTPVTITDVTGATTIYCTPYMGNRLFLYDGAKWVGYISNEFSLALGTLTAARPYDVFCYANAGAPTLELTAWTNDTTRATALAYQDGVLVKSGNATRRYLGTLYTTSTTTTADSEGNRYLYNYYHRKKRSLKVTDATANWTYTTPIVREANGSTANRVNFVQGVAEDSIWISSIQSAGNTNTGVLIQSGFNLDSTTSFYEATGRVITAIANGVTSLVSVSEIPPQLGAHFISWNEYSGATGTTTWTGSSVAGLKGNIFA